MSDILTHDERRELTAEKYELYDKHLKAKTEGERARLHKQITDIQRQLDDDANERLPYDEAQERAARALAGVRGGLSTTAEVREFLTPGSAQTDLWVTPGREQTIIPGSELRTAWLTSDTATIGSGYYFTDQLYRSLVMFLLEASGVLEAGPTIITTDHVRPIQVPYLTADATATAGTEGSEATDANITGTAVDLGAFRWDGKFTVSAEMLMSSELPLESLLTTFAQRSLANRVAQQLAIGAGSGSSECDGVFTTGTVTVGKTAAAVDGILMDEILEGFKALDKGYRKRSSIVVSDVLHTSLVSLKDDTGQYLLRTLEGGGEQLFGHPLYVEPQADQSGMSTGEVHAVMGDFGGLFVRFGPFFFRRSDADPLNPEFVWATWCASKLVDPKSLRSVKTA